MRVVIILLFVLGAAFAHRWEGNGGNVAVGDGFSDNTWGGKLKDDVWENIDLNDDDENAFDDDSEVAWVDNWDKPGDDRWDDDNGVFGDNNWRGKFGDSSWGDINVNDDDDEDRFDDGGDETWDDNWDRPDDNRWDDNGGGWRGLGRGRFNSSGNATRDQFWRVLGIDRNNGTWPFWNGTDGDDGNNTDSVWFGQGKHRHSGSKSDGKGDDDDDGDRRRYNRRSEVRRKDGGKRFRPLLMKDFRKRQQTFPSDDVLNIIKLTLGQAYTGISADDLSSAAQSEKKASEALLAAHNADVSDEDAQSIIDEAAATIDGVPAVESINSDVLGDQANKVTLILQLWKGIAEKIKSLEGSGKNYDAPLKALSKLSDSLLNAVKNSVDYVTVNLLYRDLKRKATNSKRQDEGDEGGDWSPSVNVNYNPETGATVGAGLTYSNGPFTAGGDVQYNTNTGSSANLNLGYKGDGFQVGGNFGYSPSGGPSVGLSGSWSFK